VEVELQFLYRGEGPPVVPTSLAELELRHSQPLTLVDTYYDTESLALRRVGCSLRIRQSDGEVRPWLTFKGPARKQRKAKRRHETELEIASLPQSAEEMGRLLRGLGLERTIRRLSGLEAEPTLQPIGELRNRRSRHRYEHGLHRLELTWDELEFPTGDPETRLEVEARSELAERLLELAAAELAALFGDDLVPASKGKARELCERLYPELLAA
jgi:inorganic triphosphatase YgiF